MSDLISRSALMMHLNDYALQEAPFFEDQSKEAYNAIQNCMKAVEDAPTVEAKPVVHGEWKYDWLGEYICSNCYERVNVKEVMGEPAWDWCPACGADMRKKVE